MFDLFKKESLREEAHMAGQIFEDADDPILIFDPVDGEIIECNSLAERQFERPRKQIFRMKISDLYPKKDREANTLKTRNIKKGTITDFPSSIERPDGTILPVLVSAQLFEFGDRTLVLGFFTDINPHKKQKERIKKFYRDLEHSRSEFVSLVSHQMRSPLSTINWYSEMLLSGDLGDLKEEQKKYFKVVYENNLKMIKLINALLNTSRVEMGTLTVNPVDMNVGEIVKKVAADKELHKLASSRSVKISISVSKSLPAVAVDARILEFIIKTLLNNSITYTSEKDVVTVSADAGKNYLTISVMDHGVGIPLDERRKVFEKLYRGSNIDDKIYGTGMNLYIAKTILDKTGGKITFKSRPMKETVFTVSIPLKGMKKLVGMRTLS